MQKLFRIASPSSPASNNNKCTKAHVRRWVACGNCSDACVACGMRWSASRLWHVHVQQHTAIDTKCVTKRLNASLPFKWANNTTINENICRPFWKVKVKFDFKIAFSRFSFSLAEPTETTDSAYMWRYQWKCKIKCKSQKTDSETKIKYEYTYVQTHAYV